MAKVYMISVRWVNTTINPEMIDGILGQHGDWLRFSGFTWLLTTERDALFLHGVIMPRLKPEDSLLIIEAARAPYNGWAPKWIWDWLSSRLGPPTGPR